MIAISIALPSLDIFRISVVFLLKQDCLLSSSMTKGMIAIPSLILLSPIDSFVLDCLFVSFGTRFFESKDS